MENLQGALVGTERRGETDELEASLNALIERRTANAEHADDAQAREESWKESVRQYHGEIREANRWAWISYYRRLSRAHAGLCEHFEGKAAALDPGEGGG